MSDIKWVIAFLIALWVAWFFFIYIPGGTTEKRLNDKFIEPHGVWQQGDTYDKSVNLFSKEL